MLSYAQREGFFPRHRYPRLALQCIAIVLLGLFLSLPIARAQTFAVSGTLTVDPDGLFSAVIDTKHGFAYFGTGFPGDFGFGRIVKVDLSSFRAVRILSLRTGEDNLVAGVIDPENGYAYFTTGTFPTHPSRIVKIGLANFMEVDSLGLSPDEFSCLCTAIIDTENGFAYFGTFSEPARVLKVDLSSFRIVDSLTLRQGDDDLNSAVIDPIHGFAYFGTFNGRIVKVNLHSFKEVRSVALNGADLGAPLTSAVIDPQNGFAYFGDYRTVTKIRLSSLQAAGSLTLNPGEAEMHSAVIDTTNGFAYFGLAGLGHPGITEINLSTFTESRSVFVFTDPYLRNGLWSAVIDTYHGYAYWGSDGGEPRGIIIRVSL